MIVRRPSGKPRIPQSGNDPIETPRQLGDRYSRELRDLVDDGEISVSVARRIMDDLSGEPPTLRWSVWCAYVEDADRNASVASLGALRKRRPSN